MWNEFLEKELWDQSTCVSVSLTDIAEMLAPCGSQNNGPQRCPNPNILEPRTLRDKNNFGDMIKLSWRDYPKLSRWVLIRRQGGESQRKTRCWV